VISAPAPDTQGGDRQFRFFPRAHNGEGRHHHDLAQCGDAPHIVASSSKLFKSKAFDTDGSFSFTFTTPGVYEVC